MTLKELFTNAGITLTDQQFADISKQVVMKQAKTKGNGKRYRFKSFEFTTKTPTQMKVCVEILETLGTATMEEWAENAGDVLVTRQDPAKVIAFYRKRMIEDGLIAEVGTAEPVEKLEDEDQPDATEEEQEEFHDPDDDEPDFRDDPDQPLMAPMEEAYKESREMSSL